MEVTEVLRRHVAHRLERNLGNGWTQERPPWLFVTEAGAPMDAAASGSLSRGVEGGRAGSLRTRSGTPSRP